VNDDGGVQPYWLQRYADPALLTRLQLDPNLLSAETIQTILLNPNCKPLHPNERDTELSLDRCQILLTCRTHSISFINIQYHHLYPREKDHGTHVTRLEAQALNDFTAAVQYKHINRSQIENETYLLSAFRDDIVALSYAMKKYLEIEGPFELYLNIHRKSDRPPNEWWDTVLVPFPISQVFVNLRTHYKNGLNDMSEPLSPYYWRDAGNQMEPFRRTVVVLIQLLWLAVHPNR